MCKTSLKLPYARSCPSWERLFLTESFSLQSPTLAWKLAYTVLAILFSPTGTSWRICMKCWRSSSKVIKSWVRGGSWGKESLKHIKKKKRSCFVYSSTLYCVTFVLKHTHLGLCLCYMGISTIYIGYKKKQGQAGWVCMSVCRKE